MTGSDALIDVQIAGEFADVPDTESLIRWAGAALYERHRGGELVIRVVDEPEIVELNDRYRHRSNPTNVLSFPADVPEVVAEDSLGDVVVCAPVVAREAREQGKTARNHWCHMVVHGVLHLLGHDHQTDAEAKEMEGLEVKILAGLGVPDPYS